MTTETPTPRLVPDRPSDAAKVCRFCGWRGVPETAADPYTTDGTVEVCGQCNNAESMIEVPAKEHPTLTEQLQQKCSDWGAYWRAPDAHGVILSTEQALELLRDALGVEVEIQAAEAPAERGGGMLPDALVPFAAEWYTFCERAPHAERIKVSGELAEAIVQTVCRLAAAPAGEGISTEEMRALDRAAEGCTRGDDAALLASLREKLSAGRATPAAPAEGDWFGDVLASAGTVEPLDTLSAPRVTGGREDLRDAARYRALRRVVMTVKVDLDGGQDDDDYLDRMADMALQAANGGEVGNG